MFQVKKITFSPKGSKESKKVVTIWAGMTVQDLADSMDKDIGKSIMVSTISSI